MSTALNVSEGFPVDGRIFETPQVNLDNEQPRYLGCLFSMIDPDTARSRPWTKGGGIEVSNPCLRYVKNFLRKGRITPLLKDTHDFLPFDLVKKTTDVNPLQAGYFAQPIPVGYVPPSLPPANGQFQPGFGSVAVGGPSPYGNMVGRLALPGEQIYSILIGSENMAQNNVPRGIVEHRSLIGKPYRPQQIGEFYGDPEIWEAQKAIFPSYPALPIRLDDLESLLDVAQEHTLLRELVDDFRLSLTQFRDYADATIQQVHNEMRESAGRRGYVFRYTSMDLVLLEQLGLERQDRAIRQNAQVGNERLEGMFQQWLAIQIEEKQANLDRMKRTGEVPEINETTSDPGQEGQSGTSGYSGASGQITNASSEGQEQTATAMADTEKFECVCGRDDFKSARALQTHQTVHCEAAKAQKAE